MVSVIANKSQKLLGSHPQLCCGAEASYFMDDCSEESTVMRIRHPLGFSLSQAHQRSDSQRTFCWNHLLNLYLFLLLFFLCTSLLLDLEEFSLDVIYFLFFFFLESPPLCQTPPDSWIYLGRGKWIDPKHYSFWVSRCPERSSCFPTWIPIIIVCLRMSLPQIVDINIVADN